MRMLTLLVFAGFANMMLQKVFDYTKENTYSGIGKAIYGKWFEGFVGGHPVPLQHRYVLRLRHHYRQRAGPQRVLPYGGKGGSCEPPVPHGCRRQSSLTARALLASRDCHHLRHSASFPDAQDYGASLHSIVAISGILYITIVVVHTHQRSNVDDVPRVYHPLLRSGRGCELRLRPCPLLDRGQRDEGELHWFR